ncbi:phage tail assembly chaperone family protein, TAC [Azorhizophilus paspali]|uniref:Phage tail assembly chaperone family protein, TAC n=1 Tax=Azorhizophilus paspali TaxID=69963 RepID=A0ABV6SMF7_AZOPA
MTDFSLDLIKSTGAVVGAPVEKEISWSVGAATHTAKICVRLSSYDQALREFELQKEGSDVLVSRIMASIVRKSGDPVFTDATQITGDPETGEGKLCASLFFSLLRAINEANGYTGDQAKN